MGIRNPTRTPLAVLPRWRCKRQGKGSQIRQTSTMLDQCTHDDERLKFQFQPFCHCDLPLRTRSSTPLKQRVVPALHQPIRNSHHCILRAWILYSTRGTATPLRVVDHGRRSSDNIKVNCPASYIAIPRSNHAALPWQWEGAPGSPWADRKTLEKTKNTELRKCNLLPRSTKTHLLDPARGSGCRVGKTLLFNIFNGI